MTAAASLAEGTVEVGGEHDIDHAVRVRHRRTGGESAGQAQHLVVPAQHLPRQLLDATGGSGQREVLQQEGAQAAVLVGLGDEYAELGVVGLVGVAFEGGDGERFGAVFDHERDAAAGGVESGEAACLDGEDAPAGAEEPVAQVGGRAGFVHGHERGAVGGCDRADADDAAVGVECIDGHGRTEVHVWLLAVRERPIHPRFEHRAQAAPCSRVEWAVPRGSWSSMRRRAFGPLRDGPREDGLRLRIADTWGMNPEPIRVFLLDDHEVVRRGLCELLERDGDIKVVGEAADVAEAVRRFPAARPDVAVLDAQLPDGSGVEVCRRIKEADPGIAVVILTSYEDDVTLFAAIQAGAAGFLLKQVRGNDLVDGVRTLAAGGSLLDARMTGAVLERLRAGPPTAPELDLLSEQEQRILELIGEGLTNRQIAERMHLAEKTVKNYVTRVLGKLGLERRTQAAVLASRLFT